MGFLDRFRKKDPNLQLEGFVREAVGDEGHVCTENEPGICLFEYKGLWMALDMTEHPFLSVMYCDSDSVRDRYGLSMDELRSMSPQGMEFEVSDDGSCSMMSSEPLLHGEETDCEAFRSLLDSHLSRDAALAEKVRNAASE